MVGVKYLLLLCDTQNRHLMRSGLIVEGSLTECLQASEVVSIQLCCTVQLKKAKFVLSGFIQLLYFYLV